MNLTKLLDKLVTAARAHPPAEDVPYGFERRVIARLTAIPAWDPWAIWGQALWRAVAPCVGITLLLGAWIWFSPTANSGGTDLSQEFEKTVLAAAEPEPTADSTW